MPFRSSRGYRTAQLIHRFTETYHGRNGCRRPPAPADRAHRAPRRGKEGHQDDIKDVYLEGKATGYDPKAMRQVVRIRKMKPDDRKEQEAILEVYLNALGIS
jgi:uncharacterized protein (UPF0335 family)